MTDLNVKAVFFMAQAAARRMVEKGAGNIIMLSSVAGIQGGGLSAMYASTKGAVRRRRTRWPTRSGRAGSVSMRCTRA